MVSHIFVYIFQTERFSAVTFDMSVMEENELSFDTIFKSLKKNEHFGPGSCKSIRY